MTLDGTNTWVLSAPGSPSAVVVDPGPDDERHLAAVVAAARARGARVGAILLTHGHLDHSAGARRLADLARGATARVGVRALDPAHRLGDEGLVDGDVVELGDLSLEVLATPGHSADSLCFVLRPEGVVLTGDTVLGRGTSVVAHPDGRLASYLASLDRLERLAEVLDPAALLPGHGPVLPDLLAVVRFYRTHRLERLDQVRAAVAAVAAASSGAGSGAGSGPALAGGQGLDVAQAVVERVYADVDQAVWPAALLSVRAQLEYLQTHSE